MLKAYSLAVKERGYWWSISPLTGSLLRQSFQPSRSSVLPNVVSRAIAMCDEPYECGWNPDPSPFELEPYDILLIKRYNRILHFISNKRFLFSRLYASSRVDLFTDTRQAFGFIAALPEQIIGRENHCLQRTLLAAKTSKSFKENGVIFIGAQIQSATMHAWIIERDEQPDHQDRIWVNFRPLLALTWQ